MASKSAPEPETAEVIEEQLDAAEKLLDRVKVLYEQFFLGIQKQPPSHLHTDVERKLRELSQLQIRNTALRYRFATAQQKFGSYNSYWRRTLRQIELGTYARNLAKVGRAAVRSGEEVPEEILAAMPKRMRDQIRRDREAALALEAARRKRTPTGAPELASTGENDVDIAAFVREPSELRRRAVARNGAHLIDPSDAEMDLSAFFAEVASTVAGAEDERKTTEMPPLGRASTRPAVGPAVPVERVPTPQQPALERPAWMAGEGDVSVRFGEPGGAAAVPSGASVPSVPSMPVPAAPAPMTAAPMMAAPMAAALVRAAAVSAPGPVKRPSSPAMPPPLPSVRPPAIPSVPRPAAPFAPSQQARPLPVMPGASASHAPGPVESLKGPFDRPGPSAGGAVPSAGGGAAPSAGGGAVPSAGGGAVSSVGGGAVPSAGGGAVQSAGGGAVSPVGAGAMSSARGPGLVPSVRSAVPSVGAGAVPSTGAGAGMPSAGTGAVPSVRGAVPSVGAGAVPSAGAGAGMPSAGTGAVPSAGAARPSAAIPRIAPVDAPRAPGAPPSTASVTAPPSAAARPSPSGAPSNPVSRPSPSAASASPSPLDPPALSSPSEPYGRPSPSAPSASSATPSAAPRTSPSEPYGRPSPSAPASAAPRPAPSEPYGRPSAPSVLRPTSTGAGTPPRSPVPPRSAPPVRPTPPSARPAPPAGMTDADVNVLYAKYVKAKEAVGEAAGPGTRDKLLKTIHAQAPKIMEQYKAKGVDFSVVVKDNQVIIRAKPKT